MSKYLDLKAKRTDAVAPRSLFGTTNEIKDKKALREAKNLKTPEKPLKRDKLADYKPDDVNQVMTNEENKYSDQKDKAKHANMKLKQAELNALNFHPKAATVQSGRPDNALAFQHQRNYSPYRHDVKLHPRDIALAEQYNRFGFELRNDASYDHYKASPSNDNYQVLGNVLGKGGLFSYKGQEYATVEPNSKPPKTSALSKRSMRSTPRAPSVPIPANIRHTYGDSVCRDIIEDAQMLIKEGMSPVPSKGTPTLSKSGTPNSSSSKPGQGEPPSEAADTFYDDLGNALRQDIFNGVSYSHLTSLNTSSYTADIAKRSTESYPPKFAVQRNADSKWNEDMVVNQRLMKRWDSVMAERLQKPE